MEHLYVSTYCQHGVDEQGNDLHKKCASPVGVDAKGKEFVRNPAKCKICGNACLCPCHNFVKPVPNKHGGAHRA